MKIEGTYYSPHHERWVIFCPIQQLWGHKDYGALESIFDIFNLAHTSTWTICETWLSNFIVHDWLLILGTISQDLLLSGTTLPSFKHDDYLVSSWSFPSFYNVIVTNGLYIITQSYIENFNSVLIKVYIKWLILISQSIRHFI